MAYPTLTPPNDVNIAPGSGIDYEPRVRRANFGDGYSQRSGDGLNALSRKLQANFQVLTYAEAKTLLDFFEERKGYLPFMWTPPDETVARQWIAPSWKKTYTGKRITDVSVTLEETFDP